MGAAERKAPPAAPRLRFPHLPQSGARWVMSSSCQTVAGREGGLRQFLQVPAPSCIHSSKGYGAPSLGAARSSESHDRVQTLTSSITEPMTSALLRSDDRSQFQHHVSV